MNKCFGYFKHLRISFNIWLVSGISLALIGLSYALYLPSLGFYFDDWPQLYSMIIGGSQGIKNYYLFDSRPFCFWPELFLFKLWGTNPILWHLANYFLHWLIGLSIYFAFRQIWPEHKQNLLWVILLFSVYPLFDQQSVALVYIAPKVSYLFFFLSVGLMVAYAKGGKGKYLFLVASLIANMLNLFTVEYFIGLELIRPIILWFIMRDGKTTMRVKNVLFHWLPYFGLIIIFSFWRLLLVENLRGLSLSLIPQFLSSPLQTLRILTEFFVKDLMAIILTVWYPTFETSIFDLTSAFRILGLVLIFAVLIILMVINFLLKHQNTEPKEIDPTPIKQQVFLGLTGVVAGCIPFWLIMRSYSEKVSVYADRFGFPSMWAASIFIVALISFLFIGNQFRRNTFLIILVALAVGRNFTNVNTYKWSTTWQHRIFSQLKWRVPEIKSKTVFLSDIELFTNMGVYPTAFAINLLYPKGQSINDLDYYYLTISKYFPLETNDLDGGIEITQDRWNFQFQGNTKDSIVLFWPRTDVNCLWVLSENDKYNPLISSNTRLALPASNLSLIDTYADVTWPDENLFGKENQDTWCYFYETADLARQNSDWNEVTLLYEQAKLAGYSPVNGVELIPFIEAFARLGKADIAAELTVVAKSLTPHMRDYMCDTWNRVAKDLQNDPLFDAEYKSYSEQDLCWEVK